MGSSSNLLDSVTQSHFSVTKYMMPGVSSFQSQLPMPDSHDVHTQFQDLLGNMGLGYGGIQQDQFPVGERVTKYVSYKKSKVNIT